MCINYRNLNKPITKDHPSIYCPYAKVFSKEFPLLLFRWIFGVFQIHIHLSDQEKTYFTCLFGTLSYRECLLDCVVCMLLFNIASCPYFFYFLEDIMKVSMDDFSVFGSSFENCLENLEKVLERCVKVNLVLHWEKYHFMVKKGMILGHSLSKRGFKVHTEKIEVWKIDTSYLYERSKKFLGPFRFFSSVYKRLL